MSYSSDQPVFVSMQFMHHVRQACAPLRVYYMAPFQLKFVNNKGTDLTIDLDQTNEQDCLIALKQACATARFLLL